MGMKALGPRYTVGLDKRKQEKEQAAERLRPLLAATIHNREAKQVLPTLDWKDGMFGSAKFDGYRVLIPPSLQVVSRKLKPFPAKGLRRYSDPHLSFVDGELIAGDPTDPEVRNKTSSQVMTHDSEAEDVKLYVFDWFGLPGMPYADRYDKVWNRVKQLNRKDLVIVPQIKLSAPAAAFAMEDRLVQDGFEGMMLRHPMGPYKMGRSTMREQYLMKWKRFTDSEARILDYFEQEENTNEATIDALGYTKRSSHKSGKKGTGRLGGWYVEDIKLRKGVKFHIGTWKGMTLKGREKLWKLCEKSFDKLFKGKVLNYRYQDVGTVDKPIFGVITGFREAIDL